jgi:hypothetical protein
MYGRSQMKCIPHAMVSSLIVIPLLAGCCAIPIPSVTVGGSGTAVTVEREITGFEALNVSNAFEVDVRQRDDYRVVIRVDDNLEQYLEVVEEGNALRIGLEPGRAYNLSNATLEAEVGMPALTGTTLSGASRVTVSGFESSGAFQADLSGASRLEGDIEAGDSGFRVSGSSRVVLRGVAADVTLDASGSSRVDLTDFAAQDADVEASGSSRVIVNLSGTLDAVASGASHVYYLGSPTLGDIDTSGGSSVERQ